MTQKPSRKPTKEDGLDALLFAVAAILFMSALEAFRAGETYIAGVLFVAALISAVAYQVLQRYHFEWEDDVNEVAPSAETIADTIESASPAIADRIRTATTPDENYTCDECGKEFDTESELTGHSASHS